MPTQKQIVASHAATRYLWMEESGKPLPYEYCEYVPQDDISEEVQYLKEDFGDAGWGLSDRRLSEIIAEFYHWTATEPDEVKAFHRRLHAAGLLFSVPEVEVQE